MVANAMAGMFRVLLYLGVLMGLAGYLHPYWPQSPALAQLPQELPLYLSYGGLGLILIGGVGRSLTRRPPEGEWR